MSGEALARASAPRRPRLGFLGVGWMGQRRMRSILAAGAAEAAAVADPSTRAAEAAAAASPGCLALPTLEALLEQDLDGLVIASPSALHAEQVQRALERGLAVFCQKPLGRSAAEARRVVESARAADRLLAVDLSYRAVAGVDRIRGLVQGGALGQVYAVNLVFHNAYGPDKPWCYDPRLAGGGCLIDLGIHLLDLALWTLGFPSVEAVSASLRAGGGPARPGQAVEDHASAHLELSSGAAVQLSCSWRLAAGQDCQLEAAFYGTRGGAALRNLHGSFVDFVAERFHGTRRELLAGPPDDWGGAAGRGLGRAVGRGRALRPRGGDRGGGAGRARRHLPGRGAGRRGRGGAVRLLLQAAGDCLQLRLRPQRPVPGETA